MRHWKRKIARIPIFGRAILILVRAKSVAGYILEKSAEAIKWLFQSNEVTNFTYDIEETNTHYLASLIAEVTNIEFSLAMSYIDEIEQDQVLREHIAKAVEKSDWSNMADKTARYGRRVGWYALVRVLKPKTIIETGVDKGLGACVLTAALKKNKEEGFAGRYFGTDINPNAGYLLSGEYANYGQVLYGDSIESLEVFDGAIDLFINDSDHSADYEAQEYQVIAGRLSPHAVLLADNAHVSDKLLQFSLQTNRRFVYFQEKPRRHWYPGAGIGISFRR